MEIGAIELSQKLEFDRVLALIENECLGVGGRESISSNKVSFDFEQISRSLEEVDQMKSAIQKEKTFPIAAYDKIEEELEMLRLEGKILGLENISRLVHLARTFESISLFFRGDRKSEYHLLYELIKDIPVSSDLLSFINRFLDEKGEIKANATPELASIRSKILYTQRSLDQTFRKIINECKSKGWLTDNAESFRNGRRVLSVPAEHKRKIRGIIHDESATGKTVFIEPDVIITINNDLFDHYSEEKREIVRILRTISEELRPHQHTFQIYYDQILTFDSLNARARFALQIGGFRPKLNNEPCLGLIQAFHPLLYLNNKETGKVTVPFDLVLHSQNRILVLSGPNAGGKTVTMKTVGLIHLMVQSGILPSCDPKSEIGIFRKIFVDIGDQQSLDNELSTYSSRLQNMKVFYDQANEDSLLLIDEFGSGTDPQIGGGIAESMLKAFNQKKVFGVLTTHYPNLKIFAYNTLGVVNGSMTFDKKELRPTYSLRIGKPGSSYAFEIAQNSGLPMTIIRNAKRLAGKKTRLVDELLTDLQDEKEKLEQKVSSIASKEKQLDKLIKNYDQLQGEFEVKRKRLKLEAKEFEMEKLMRQNKEVEQIIRQLKEEKNLESAMEVSRKTKTQKEELHQEIESLNHDLYYKNYEQGIAEIKEGSFVKLRKSGASGQVESIDKKKARVLVGEMTLTVSLKELVVSVEPLPMNPQKGVRTTLVSSTSGLPTKIDLRGMRKAEALKILEGFMDAALINNASLLEVIHGKGDGVLKKAVHHKLKEYSAVKEIRHPEDEMGGDGVTFIRLS